MASIILKSLTDLFVLKCVCFPANARTVNQWRARLKAQEDLLQHLERSNTVTHQAAAARTASDLRQVVQDGRALVRSWSQKDTLATLMPEETLRRKGRRKLPAVRARTNPTCSPEDPTSKREELVNATIHSYVRAGIAEDAVTLRQRQRPNGNNNNNKMPSMNRPLDLPAAPDPAHDAHYVISTEGKRLPRRKGGSALDIDESSSHSLAGAGLAAADSNGWFWGANGPAVGVNADPPNSCPGQGAMGAYWAKVGGGTALDPHVALPAPRRTPTAISMKHRESPGEGPSRSVPRPAHGQSTATASAVDSHHRDRPQGDRYSNSTFIGVASTKAAVRSASNRATELSRLLAEGNNPPREECLAKAESAVRAAQHAVSCSNERMFELELMIDTTGGGGSGGDGGSGGNDDNCGGKEKHAATKSGIESMGAEVTPEDNCSKHDERTIVTPSLVLHIAQLTKQMQLAQSLQAASLAASATLARRFAREDEAAIMLQARVRGYVVRSQEKPRKRGTERNRRIPQPSAQSEVTDLSTANEEIDFFARDSSTAALFSLNTPVEEEAVPPWAAEEWWTLAEEESADEVGDREKVLLGSIVKLQAIVRSRQTRSRTFAAVNARFVEYFDEQYQYPYYVCTETNRSQWNRPFGFSVSLVCRDSVAAEEENFQGGGGDGSHHDTTPKEVGASISDNECAQAAVIIQCAVRAAKARARFAEMIVSDIF